MQNAAGGGTSVQSDGRNDSYHSVVSDLVSLIDRLQTSMELIESAIATEAFHGDQETATDVVVLDDVTPRYARAQQALNTCNAGLGLALQVLRDSGTSSHPTAGPAKRARRPLRSLGSA
jgi:hypothetical protein